MDNYSLSDIAAASHDSGGFGGSGAWVLIILFALIFGWGGNGWGGNRSGAQPVTEAGLCDAMNFNNLENAVGRLGDSTNAGFTGLQRDLCTGFSAINSGINQVRFDNQQCCCETQRAVDGVNYNGAMNTAAINANTTAQTQKILDAIAQNKIESLQAQVNELKTQNLFCGIPRISPYGFGVIPQFASGCCGCNNI